MGPTDALDTSRYVGGDGQSWILWGKLLGTLVASGWLVFVGGITTVLNAFVMAHARILGWLERVTTGLITGIFGGAGEVGRLAWRSAFRAAVDANPVLAPALIALEVIAVVVILSALRDRVI